MSIKRIFQALALAVVICPWNAIGGAIVGINSVDIVPIQPTETDAISFDIYGWASQYPSWVDHNDFSQNGSSLQLDLYINTGDYYAFSEWSYSKPISSLPANTYTLEVNSFDYDDGSLDDTYIVEFTVVPEPMSLVFLGVGAYILRFVSKRNDK
jgi:hypothetical protein